jgi:hypothetical protein
MNCPYCNKHIPAFTGLQELQKFQKHLRTCKRNPAKQTVVEPDGRITAIKPKPDLLEALEIRANSGQ